MNRWLILIFCLLFWSFAHADSPEPFQLVRALHELQTGIVQGKPRARDDQPSVLADIGKQFMLAEPDVWSQPRNARAVMIWSLSGGSPLILRRVLVRGRWPEEEAQIGRGILAFIEGRAQQARDILLAIDPRKMDPALGGQIALVQAALLLTEDRERAIAALAIARLLAPGTLVEETALRRQISLVGETTDVAAFAALSRQYSRRFANSLYAEDFRQAFASVFTRIGVLVGGEHMPILRPVLMGFDPDERCRLAILIARASLIEGAWSSAQAFSEIVMMSPNPKSCDGPRSRLYRSAAGLALGVNEPDRLALTYLDPSRLNLEDQVIRKASLQYSQIVETWPEAQAKEGEVLPGDETLAAAARLLEMPTPTIGTKRR